MIQLRNICKAHITEDVHTMALDSINLQIDAGDFLSVMGPSGCGKSTLLNVVGLLDQPSSGEYYFHQQQLVGINDGEQTDVRKRHIGIIFQNFNLVDELTVFQNVELALMYQGTSKSIRRERVFDALDKVGIAHRARHYPQQLSGGQQQRVAIARAMIGKPDLLLADEPTGNLDSRNGDEIMELIQKLNEEGSAVMMVTHDEHHTAYGSRVLRLMDGKIVEDARVAR